MLSKLLNLILRRNNQGGTDELGDDNYARATKQEVADLREWRKEVDEKYPDGKDEDAKKTT